jgi:hypothetical protein
MVGGLLSSSQQAVSINLIRSSRRPCLPGAKSGHEVGVQAMADEGLGLVPP